MSADVISGRMLKLAAARSTGALRVFGDAEGVIHFSEGHVVFARSGRTGPLESTDAVPQRAAPAGDGAAERLAQLDGILMVIEPTVDAVVDLLSGSSLPRRFRPAAPSLPSPAPACSIAVSDLLAEVARQQRQLRQMSAVISPDTAVRRNPQLAQPRVQVSALQWALLIRAGHGTTPRALARALGRTVFGTTADVYGLIVLGLLCADGPTQPDTVAAQTTARDEVGRHP
jgi:hypothetical protein